MKKYLIYKIQQISKMSVAFYSFTLICYILCMFKFIDLIAYFISSNQLSFKHMMIALITFIAIHTTTVSAIIFYKFTKNEE